MTTEEEETMRVFVAGGAGAIGRPLVAQLVARGHEVTATTTSSAKLDLLARLGAEGVVMDGLDAVSVGEAVAKARPDAIVHEMTGLSAAHAGKIDTRRFERWFAVTNRLRIEGTDHLLAAAEATGVSHFVAQSYSSWNGIRTGGWVKTEEDPLDPDTGTGFSTTAEAAPATARGCTSRTPRALPSWLWRIERGAYSTSSTTNRPRRASGCRIWRRARGRSPR
jgi:nucleoside-diphosphate-sugar epimerase